MKLKVILSFIFLLVYGISYYSTTQTKNQRVNFILKEEIKNLNTHYNLTMDYFIQDVKSVKNNILNNKKAIRIFSEAQNATEEQRATLRDKLYKHLAPMYSRLKTRGILQFQFVFPDNKSFLRMHKPNKFGDDLTNIRYSFNHTNKTKQVVIGFEQGRTTHAFRYVFPCYDKEGNYLGAIETSLSSYSLQDKLSDVNKLHSHFLVNKQIFDVKAWKEQDLTKKYIQSIEHKDYMYALTKHFNKNKMIYSKNNIILPLRKQIDTGISTKESFALYTPHKDTMKTIAFLPIKNTQEKKTVAYIVSYTDNKNIYNIYEDYNKSNILRFIGLLLLFYFIYKTLNHKQELELEVKEKTESLEYLNDNLEIRIEEKTKEQNQLLSIFDKGNAVLFKWNNDEPWSVGHVSSSIVKLLEYEPSDFYEKRISYDECIYKEDLNRVNQELITARMLETNDYFQHKPYRVVSKSGAIKWVLDYTLIVRDKNNIIIYYLGYINDITDLKNKDEQIIKSEKLASMGDMIGNIAHQWRQPLSVISTGATGMKMQKEFGTLSDDQFNETCDVINDNAQYLSKTIDDFRNFIKGDRIKKDFILKDNIDSFLHLVEGSIKSYSINIVLDLQENIKINGYPNDLIQCFMNIFNNAKDVIKKKDDRFIFITTSVLKDTVIIKIKDSGDGIPKDIISKVFEPYFTTKHKSQGTGLGLHMTNNLIVDGMNGTIEVNNATYTYKDKEYTGAEFTILLPMS